jgi:hypothetical protein
MKRCFALVIFICFLIPVLGYAQVNIEQYRSSTVTGNINNSQYVNISTSLTRSVDSLYSIGLQYYKAFSMSNALDGFLISKVQYGERNADVFLNRSFYHLRFISKQSYGEVFPETFFQYESNNSALTELRYLGGMGVRMSALPNVIVGTSVVLEWYKEDKMYVKTHAWRLSQYIKTAIEFNDVNRIDIVFYIQPKLNDFSNIRYFTECGYTSRLTKRLLYSATLTAKYFSHSSSFKDVELFYESGVRVVL